MKEPEVSVMAFTELIIQQSSGLQRGHGTKAFSEMELHRS